MPEEKIAVARTYGIEAPVHVLLFEGNLFVVDGRQRVKAARAVWSEQEEAKVLPDQRITVPFLLVKDSLDELFAKSRILNVHTEESPMMRARSMSRLLMEELKEADGKTRKRTTAEVATIYGVSDQTVLNSLKLFKSSDTVKQALSDLKQPTIGLLIADLPEEAQQKVLAELKADQRGGAKITVDRAKKKVAEAQGRTVNSPKDKVETIQRTLQQLADKSAEASCTDCKDMNQYKAANVRLLQALDTIARAAFGGGKLAFPTPIKNQRPGYTLDVIAKTGD
jgi:ParB-like chromosome segregation protein Spo0J